MKILHITAHLGGGVGTVVMDWVDRVTDHHVICLDTANSKALSRGKDKWLTGNNAIFCRDGVMEEIEKADIVLVHYWDHPMLDTLFADPIPDCRLVFWCHKNITATMFNPVWWDKVLNYPDRFINTSPIQGCGCDYIWSTGDMSRFLEIKPKPHKGFNVGYVGTVDYKKLHRNFIPMCKEIAKAIPDVHFIVIGEMNLPDYSDELQMSGLFTFTGKVDDVAPYLAEMDVFGYPLRPDHYGTCEQSLGESMAAGAVPITMDNPAENIITKEPRGVLSYVDRIVSVYQHPELKHELSNALRGRAKELYSIDTMIHQWNEVFGEMMMQPKKSRNPI